MSIKLTTMQQEFVDTLRSGKYKQNSGSLEENEGFCALGVACKVAEKNGVIVKKRGDGRVMGSFLYGVQVNVFTAFSFHLSGEELIMHLNDIDKKSFAEIADEIEKCPNRFFLF